MYEKKWEDQIVLNKNLNENENVLINTIIKNLIVDPRGRTV